VRWSFAERTANRALAKKLRARGVLLRDIADRLGCGISTVAWLLRSAPTNVGRHDATIVELRRSGRTIRDIQAATGMSASGIGEAMRRLGLPISASRQGSVPPWAANANRMRARGKTLAEIAAVVGVSTQRVSFVLRAVGRTSRAR
jgi:DNA-binding CsgD family transcriptional regulator